MRAEWPKRAVRDLLVRERDRFTFEPHRKVTLPDVSTAGLYIHIPFCRSLCPYCPYNRVRYDAALVAPYVQAMHDEIESFSRALRDIEIGSIYIGGGTPTTLIDELNSIIAHVRHRFGTAGPVAIETTPDDLHDETLAKLKELGVSLLSVGVQSFNDRYLKRIGRRYRSSILPEAVSKAATAGFDTVNVDLMFALPGQTSDEALADLDTALALGADQVTLYPLFTFPYTAVGNLMRAQQVEFPRLRTRRRMYRALHEAALARGLTRVSVWGFRKGNVPRFSSVTRDNYIGIGAGAGTRLPGLFCFNTFSVQEYIRCSSGHELPIALQMKMTPSMEHFYWLYWRLYETRVPKAEFERLFAHDARVRWLLWLAIHLRLVQDQGQDYILNERGSFWIHLLQNYYVLNYINSVWTRCLHHAWPGRIEL
ncbi:MAG TPA: coproporphyrinogen-III oxidase family protein [Woeseiaceae bacterium]|jgi:oxygen-independent coproporphyrinogen-3 oxidase|nr:coproporphyrinogen-III oxidase family protein [Woeseiaceae bacterium]